MGTLLVSAARCTAHSQRGPLLTRRPLDGGRATSPCAARVCDSTSSPPSHWPSAGLAPPIGTRAQQGCETGIVELSVGGPYIYTGATRQGLLGPESKRRLLQGLSFCYRANPDWTQIIMRLRPDWDVWSGLGLEER